MQKPDTHNTENSANRDACLYEFLKILLKVDIRQKTRIIEEGDSAK